jgi:hypothetical protein
MHACMHVCMYVYTHTCIVHTHMHTHTQTHNLHTGGEGCNNIHRNTSRHPLESIHSRICTHEYAHTYTQQGEGATMFIETLVATRWSIESMNLNGNGIREHAAKAVGPLIVPAPHGAFSPSLHTLYLAKNNIGDKGAAKLIELLFENRSAYVSVCVYIYICM